VIFINALPTGTFVANFQWKGQSCLSTAVVDASKNLHITNVIGGVQFNTSGTYRLTKNTLIHRDESYVVKCGDDWFSLDGTLYKKILVTDAEGE
jgi:hypothetical protein